MTDPANSSSGHDDRGGMPVPPSFGEPAQPSDAGGMPKPSMGEQSGSGDMPRPGASGESAANGAPSTSGAMPIPGQRTSAPPEALPRFGPPGGIAAGHAVYEPGVVEVQFREGVAPTLRQNGAAPSFAAEGVGALDEVNQLLRQYGLVQAEPTFTTSREEATAAQTVARAQGIDAPHLAQFMTLHFASDADTPRIAEELTALPQVERAVVVPVALPPTVTAPRGRRDRGAPAHGHPQRPAGRHQQPGRAEQRHRPGEPVVRLPLQRQPGVAAVVGPQRRHQ